MTRVTSYRNKLLTWIMPALILSLLTLGSGACWYIGGLIQDELTRSLLDNTDKSAETINVWLTTLLLEPETIAATHAAKNINGNFSGVDNQNISRYMFLHGRYPHLFQDIYAANREGVYHTVQQQENTYSLFVGNISNRDYFKSIMSGGPAQITPPLVSRTTGLPTVFLVAPIKDEQNRPQGLIGVGIALDYVRKIAESLKVGQGGYGFVIAKDGTFISHPDNNLVFKGNILTDKNGSVNRLGQRMVAGGTGVYRYTYKGQRKVAFYHPIPVADWSVATVIPEAELYAPTYQMAKTLMIVTLVTMILVAALITLVARRLTKPLQELAFQTAQIASGNFDLATVEITSQDEIGTFAQSFNEMTEKLKSTMSILIGSEGKYRQLIETTGTGYVVLGEQGRVIDANQEYIRLTGHLHREEVIDHEMVEWVAPYHLERSADLVRTCVEQGFARNYELDHVTATGDIIPIEINATMLCDAGSCQILSLCWDISERKKAEEDKQILQDQLLQSQKMESVGQLAGGVAHDFNNMLTAILGNANLALMSKPPKHLEAHLRAILDAGSRSADLTRQLLAFARKQAVTPKILDLNETVAGMIKMLQRLIGEDIGFYWRPGHNLWRLRMDPSQIDQILANLCVNARDAIAGVGKITIETANEVIDESYRATHLQVTPGDYVMIAVSDDGCGMGKEVRDHIFEPFFTTKELGKGTGLGLATVYGIVKQNDGFINVYTEPGKGSTFKVYLPRFTDAVTGFPVEAAKAYPSGSGETILLVEDEEIILDVAEKMLLILGYRVLRASTHTEALRLAKAHATEIELLITDVIMPEMSGRDLEQHIATIIPGLRCLFTSGYTANVMAGSGILTDDVHFLSKPFSMESLAHKVGEILGNQGQVKPTAR